jgi:hypothetical protein
MKAFLIDVVVALSLAAVIAVLMLFASFNSTFIYRGF